MIASGNVRVNPFVCLRVSQDLFSREATTVFCTLMELGVSR